MNHIIKLCVLIMCVICNVSCIKHELYHSSLTYEIHIVPEKHYEYNVDENFRYFWTDANVEHGGWGKLGYSEIKEVYEDILLNDSLTITKLAHKDPVSVKSSDIFDAVITNYNLFETDHSYLITTDVVSGKVFYFLEDYPIRKQPEEIWASTINKEPCLISEYKWNLIDEAEQFYQREIITELLPQSFIYLVQICIENDDNIHWTEMQCDSLILSGVSSTRNIQLEKSIDDKCNLIGEVKPAQPGKYRKDNENIIIDEYLFASRIVSFGLPSAYQENSSWDTSDTNKIYIGFKITLANNITRRVKIDITSRMKEIPKGGLINIELKYSDLWIESSNNNGFDLNVNNWNEDAIYLNI